MELLQLVVNILALILLLIGVPYCLYLWFRAAVAMFWFQRSFKPGVSRWTIHNPFSDEAAAELFTEEGLAYRRDALQYLFRFLMAIAVMMALATLAEAIRSGRGNL